jgi:hypothetical protein
MASNNKYRLSFTAAGLLVPDMIALANQVINEGVAIEELSSEMLNRERKNTNTRFFRELLLRLKTLSNRELEILATGSSIDKKLICLLAFGRTYEFFRDFMTDVVLERISLYDFKLSEGYYNTFFFNKSIDHHELEELADSTKSKIKQVVFRVLVESGIIDNNEEKNIQVPYLDAELIRAVSEVNPKDLNILLYKD